MTLSQRLDQIETGRKKGLRDGIDALKVELKIARAALSGTDDAAIKDTLIARIEVWVAAIEALESLL